MAALLIMVIAVSSVPGKAVAFELKLPKFLQLSGYRFTTEAERREMARTTIEAKREKIENFEQSVNNYYDPLITHRVDAFIQPNMSKEKKFVIGALEGIPLGVKELGVLVYDVGVNMKITNLHAHASDSWYKWKDKRNGLPVSGNLAGIETKQSINSNPVTARQAGNLAGQLVGCGGVIGGLKLCSKACTVAKLAKCGKLTDYSNCLRHLLQ